MSDAWFASKLAPDGDVEDGCHPDEAQALELYLHERTSSTEAAQAITHPIIGADHPSEGLVRLWSFIMDALVELPPEYTQALIELVQAIEALPEPELSAEPSERPSETLWKGLPGFGHFWSDSYQSGNWRKIAKNADGQERDLLRTEHVRKAEMEARLCNAGLAGIPIDWGYEAVANALESRAALLDFEVLAATEWLILCGHSIRQGAEKGEKSWALKTHSASSTEASLDQVMSVERWSLWDKRLEEIEAESGTVSDAAKRAREAMRKAAHPG